MAPSAYDPRRRAASAGVGAFDPAAAAVARADVVITMRPASSRVRGSCRGVNRVPEHLGAGTFIDMRTVAPGSAVLKRQILVTGEGGHLDHAAPAQLVPELNQNGQEPRD